MSTSSWRFPLDEPFARGLDTSPELPAALLPTLNSALVPLHALRPLRCVSSLERHKLATSIVRRTCLRSCVAACGPLISVRAGRSTFIVYHVFRTLVIVNLEHLWKSVHQESD